MTYDRKITITADASRKATNWRPQVMLISDLRGHMAWHKRRLYEQTTV